MPYPGDNDVTYQELKAVGLCELGTLWSNLPAAPLIEHAIKQNEGTLAANGAFVVQTGKFTGRSPKDKYLVKEATSQAKIDWGAVNQPLSEEAFDRLHRRMTDYLHGKSLYRQHLAGGADPRYRLSLQVITEYAWHSLFARQLLVRPEPAEAFDPHTGFTLIAAPGCKAVPEVDGTRSETFVAIHLAKRLVLIGGTEYAGEIKKSVFTLLNYLLPEQGVFPMHCSANIGPEGDTALFFGLSGTGKTTLSADPHRTLIGDDEHGWSDDGVFNFEGGCYAKCIRLRAETEPQIWSAIQFGAVLENVVMDTETRLLDFESAALTENTRAAYPLTSLPNVQPNGMGGHPKNVVFLTADAFGVLPPLSRLTPAQAMYQFLSGYTAKVAGTERGLGNAPEATFSACFGQPFLPLSPTVYARLLGEKLAQQGATVWLVNTGWSGGPFGVGQRMRLDYTRAMLGAALHGALDQVAFRPDPVFGLAIPEYVPGVPTELLSPRQTWSDPAAYDVQATDLAQRFHANFQRFAETVSPEVRQAGPC